MLLNTVPNHPGHCKLFIQQAGVHPVENWVENKPFTKIADLKTDLKKYNTLFHTRSTANEFTRILLKKFTKLHFLTESKKTFSQK